MHKTPPYCTLATPLAAVALGSLLFLSACKSNKSSNESQHDKAVVVPELHQNNLSQAENPSDFLLTQEKSHIHWQPWSKQVFADATKEQKTVFAFMGNSTDSHSLEILRKINSSPSVVNKLNQAHVNILIDTKQHPDLFFFASALNLNNGKPASNSVLIWFTYEGVPISWSGIHDYDELSIDQIVGSMSDTVSHLWKGYPEYVLSNSHLDIRRRIEIISPKPVKTEHLASSKQTTRQVGSFFDPTSNDIDNISGLSVSRYINLMALAATRPDITKQQQDKYANIARKTADHLLLQGLVDPLDGGVFSGSQRSAKSLPVFKKTLTSQTQSLEALLRLYQITSDNKYLDAAEHIDSYIETNLKSANGSYSQGIIYAKHGLFEGNPCLWTLKEIEAALTEEETQLCIQAFGISELGNIPLLADRNRIYFRKNILIGNKPLSELSKLNNLPVEQLKNNLQSITKKLAKLRTEKGNAPQKDTLSIVHPTAALASAYITAYRTTQDTKYLEKAQNILQFIRTQFIDKQSGKLRRCLFKGNLQTIPATGIDYNYVCSAALDMHEATLDPMWLKWAKELYQEMNSHLAIADSPGLLEAKEDNYPYPFKVRQFTTITQIDNESTWSLAYSNATRLLLRISNDDWKKQAEEFNQHITPIVTSAPMTSIDFLTEDALLNQKIVYLKTPATPQLLQTALSHRCQIVAVKNDTIPGLKNFDSSLESGQAIVVQQSKLIGKATDTESLEKLLH